MLSIPQPSETRKFLALSSPKASVLNWAIPHFFEATVIQKPGNENLEDLSHVSSALWLDAGRHNYLAKVNPGTFQRHLHINAYSLDQEGLHVKHKCPLEGADSKSLQQPRQARAEVHAVCRHALHSRPHMKGGWRVLSDPLYPSPLAATQPSGPSSEGKVTKY